MKKKFVVVTGAAGFIGSVLVHKLYELGLEHIIGVDDFTQKTKEKNVLSKPLVDLIQRDKVEDFIDKHGKEVGFVFHLGARTDTTEKDETVFHQLNLLPSMMWWKFCSDEAIPLVYASSAATYGNGEFGFDDDHAKIPLLKPLNPYGKSKQEFDVWALQQFRCPPKWYGLKFFNVFGPNEYHKGRMASVVFHAFNQIQREGKIRLFRSHRPDVKDGEQARDFIYVKDVVTVMAFLYDRLPNDGIYNVGTGKARTFLDLAKAIFKALDKEVKIEFIDIPEDIRDTYQYFTEAHMEKLRQAGFDANFTSLEAAVEDYVKNYLIPQKHE